LLLIKIKNRLNFKEANNMPINKRLSILKMIYLELLDDFDTNLADKDKLTLGQEFLLG